MDGSIPGNRPHRFTVSDYHRMADAGIFDEDSRVELIRGQIIDMAAIGSPHLGMVNRLTRLLSALLAGRGALSVQNPVRLDDGSEPQPDMAILKPRVDDYGTATPGPGDVLLLIEVSDSTLRYDRTVKVPLYAESGVSECWLVDLAGRAVEVYRRPVGGRYAEARREGPDGILDIEALPGVAMAVGDLFRPAKG